MSRLHWVTSLGNEEEVVKCLAEGENVNAIGVKHFSALMLASIEGNVTIAELLLKAGANPNLTHPNGRTALHFAASNGHLKIVQALVAHKANVNALSRRGFTPAMDAAQSNHREIVDFLREQKTDMTLKDEEGSTADDWLEEGGVQGWFAKRFPDGFVKTPEDRKRSEDHIHKLMVKGLSADAFSAKHGRLILVWSYGAFQFDDAQVQAWAHRVAEVLFTPGLLETCEEQYLTGEELEDARKLRARRALQAARRAKRNS